MRNMLTYIKRLVAVGCIDLYQWIEALLNSAQGNLNLLFLRLLGLTCKANLVRR